MEGYLVVCRCGTGERRCCQQRCHLQIEDASNDGFHNYVSLSYCCFLFRGPTKPAQANPHPIRVCEGQRPFPHSCAVGGKIVSLQVKICSSALPKQCAICP